MLGNHHFHVLKHGCLGYQVVLEWRIQDQLLKASLDWEVWHECQTRWWLFPPVWKICGSQIGNLPINFRGWTQNVFEATSWQIMPNDSKCKVYNSRCSSCFFVPGELCNFTSSTHRIHVWYIYLRESLILNGKCTRNVSILVPWILGVMVILVGKYTSPMDPMWHWF